MSQTRTEAVEMVLSVLGDAQRTDRYLRQADDGHYYTTPDRTFLASDSPETPLYITIPMPYDATKEEKEEWAEILLQDLDDLIRLRFEVAQLDENGDGEHIGDYATEAECVELIRELAQPGETYVYGAIGSSGYEHTVSIGQDGILTRKSGAAQTETSL